MNKIISLITVCLVIFSCTKEVESPEQQARIDQLQERVNELTGQLNSSNTQNTQFQATITQLQADLAEAEADLSEAEADLTEVEADLDAIETQLEEIADTIVYWFGEVNGDYEFDVFSNGVFIGSYAWEIGISDDGGLVANSYIWSNDGCYEFIPAISFGSDSETYVNNASFDDFGLVSYNVDGSLFGVTGLVNYYQTFTRVGNSLVFTLTAYQGTTAVYSLQSVGGVSASDIPASDFCD